MALFLAIGAGYALGQVSIFGFALGAGAVLFTGLLIGAIAPKAAPPAMVGTLGLLMFLYGVGIQYGQQFFAGLKGPGLAWNVLGLVGVIASLLVALQAGAMLGLSVPLSVGLFAGSGTSTPTLQAALAASGSSDPAIGYSVSYPFGVIGPILIDLPCDPFSEAGDRATCADPADRRSNHRPRRHGGQVAGRDRSNAAARR